MNPPPLRLLQRDLQQQVAPPADVVSGPAFPPAVKALATALVLALVVAGAMALVGAPAGPRLEASDWAFLLAAAAVVGTGYWGIMTSRTRFDSVSIEQSWLWRKKVNLTDVTQVKLISVPGMSWLIVPRLVVRTGYGLTTFHAGDPAVLAKFRLLAHGA